MRFVVVYDACVLYPAPLRDLLMRLAISGLYAARWTEQIHDEWTRNLLKKRTELADALPRTVGLMNQAVPDALVTGHEPLIPALQLPDPDDRHVLAAAIRAGAQLIITFNLKDFPTDTLASFGVEAVHPDTFLEQQFELNEGLVLRTVHRHRASLRKVPRSISILWRPVAWSSPPTDCRTSSSYFSLFRKLLGRTCTTTSCPWPFR
ncbi:PIN domain-containing protein [Ectothiorhodospira lacustris]|uniref:PIN domain-containing protein n=1 Tax=Ectothiorhodospira lacustris TaxID=2899127 RepID=UPI001EE79C67|nr:PIN domain-containing protein [Ectothiorhodospira lacustris]MCG5511512.1 PIN domain-containing protein [Ectothiorhodospira lacustris]MCG5523298.1 PIN domain-containing protein [Ectothiorhodospira lacustris]